MALSIFVEDVGVGSAIEIVAYRKVDIGLLRITIELLVFSIMKFEVRDTIPIVILVPLEIEEVVHVINDDIDNHVHSHMVRFIDHLAKIGEGSETHHMGMYVI